MCVCKQMPWFFLPSISHGPLSEAHAYDARTHTSLIRKLVDWVPVPLRNDRLYYLTMLLYVCMYVCYIPMIYTYRKCFVAVIAIIDLQLSFRTIIKKYDTSINHMHCASTQQDSSGSQAAEPQRLLSLSFTMTYVYSTLLICHTATIQVVQMNKWAPVAIAFDFSRNELFEFVLKSEIYIHIYICIDYIYTFQKIVVCLSSLSKYILHMNKCSAFCISSNMHHANFHRWTTN